MQLTPAVAGHVAVGTVALALYWLTFLSRKGGPRHRVAGRWFLAVMIAVTLSVGPVLFTRPGPFDPGYVVQMVYLCVCVFTVATLAFTAIRWKSDPERFRGRHFRILGPVLLVLGVVVLVAGVARQDPVTMILSWVGLVYGGAMIAFARYRGALHPKWWLGWHLNAVCGLFNAVHGTFLFFLWTWISAGGENIALQAAFQAGTTAGALALRLHFGTRYGAPLRFGPVAAPGLTA